MATNLVNVAGVFIGLVIKFFGQRGGLGVAQTEYAQTGHLNYHNLPSILLQGFIALWSGAAIGPEGTLVFLTGGLGTFVSERLKLQKDDIQVLVYSAIAGAFGGFFGSPIVGAVGAVEVHVHQGAKFVSSPDPWTHCRSSGLWCLLCDPAYVISRCVQLP